MAGRSEETGRQPNIDTFAELDVSYNLDDNISGGGRAEGGMEEFGFHMTTQMLKSLNDARIGSCLAGNAVCTRQPSTHIYSIHLNSKNKKNNKNCPDEYK